MNVRLIIFAVAAVILVGAIAIIGFTGTPGEKVPQIVNTPPTPQPVAPIKNSGIIPQPATPIESSTKPAGNPDGLVVGYLWEVEPGSPKFQAVQLPSWGILEKDFEARTYDVYIFNGKDFMFYQKARAIVDMVTFPQGGVTKFKVLGIDSKLGICALDTNVTWGVKYLESGQVKASRGAITTATSNPTCAIKNTATLNKPVPPKTPPPVTPPSPLTQPATPIELKIDIQNFAFAPSETRVTKGTKITWTNRDGAQHSVISDTGIFSGPPLPQGQSYSATVNTPGTYTYHCGPHPNMKGKIIVE